MSPKPSNRVIRVYRGAEHIGYLSHHSRFGLVESLAMADRFDALEARGIVAGTISDPWDAVYHLRRDNRGPLSLQVRKVNR